MKIWWQIYEKMHYKRLSVSIIKIKTQKVDVIKDVISIGVTG